MTRVLSWLRYGPRAFAAEVIIVGLGLLIVVVAGGPSCRASPSSPTVWTDVALVVVTMLPTW